MRTRIERGANARARRRLGQRVEACAERMLRRRGMIVLARNWRGDGGELDRVVLDGDTIVFVEVKSRTGGWIHARHAPVAHGQIQRLRDAARAFRQYYRVETHAYRFDLVTADTSAARPLAHSLRWRRDFIEGPRRRKERAAPHQAQALAQFGELR